MPAPPAPTMTTSYLWCWTMRVSYLARRLPRAADIEGRVRVGAGVESEDHQGSEHEHDQPREVQQRLQNEARVRLGRVVVEIVRRPLSPCSSASHSIARSQTCQNGLAHLPATKAKSIAWMPLPTMRF